MTITTTLENIRKDLHRRFDHAMDVDRIDNVFDSIVADHRANAQLEEFLPVLAERDAVDAITSVINRARRVVFVHRDNRVLSEVAAAITRELAGTSIVAESYGVHPEIANDDKLARFATLQGLNLTFDTARRHSTVNVADVVVYLNTEEAKTVAGQTQLTWDIPSTKNMTREQHETVVNELRARVQSLVETLGITAPKAAFAA